MMVQACHYQHEVSEWVPVEISSKKDSGICNVFLELNFIRTKKYKMRITTRANPPRQ